MQSLSPQILRQFGYGDEDGEYGQGGVHYGPHSQASGYVMQDEHIEHDTHVPPAKGDTYYRYARHRSQHPSPHRRNKHPMFNHDPTIQIDSTKSYKYPGLIDGGTHLIQEALMYLKYVLAAAISSTFLMVLLVVYLLASNRR